MDNGCMGARAAEKLLCGARRIFFVGIGGISMEGLAHMTLALGKEVTGCDRALSGAAEAALAEAGARLCEDGGDPGGCDLAVYSAAIPDTHPTVVRARALGIPLMSRADLLAALMQRYPVRVAVAGMHGKSTTVGMLAAILERAGLSPTVSCGAPLTPGGKAWQIGTGDIFLAEACEYRDSFLSLSPTLSVVTNMEWDHPDYFPDMDAVRRSFSRFLQNSPRAVVGGDCRALAELSPPDALRFGFGEGATLRGTQAGGRLRFWEGGALMGEVRLRVPGDYNAQNALAATLAARRLGVDYATVLDALADFRGVGRRMELVGEVGGGEVYLDYAHHPTEITAAIRGARASAERVLCLYQPHTYTRTKELWQEFITALRTADKTVLVDIYPAREAPLAGVTSQALAEEGGLGYASSLAAAVGALLPQMRPGTVLLVMGAGDVERAVPLLLKG